MSNTKKIREPEYIRSGLNTPMLNYKVYYMSTQEKITTFLMSFFVGGFVGWVFYGNQFLDEYGEATQATIVTNLILFTIFGLV